MQRVGIIGSGISGVSAAWLLRNTADVQLFEADARFGGHTHTYRVEDQGKELNIDTGFMVYNQPNYPILTALFDHLNIECYATNMSFAVSLDKGRMEYAGSSLRTLFSQKQNLINAGFWRMLSDIMRFNRLAEVVVSSETDTEGSLSDFLNRHAFGSEFRHDYLFPMAAAIWSCPMEKMAEFPAQSFLRFFYNHGLIKIKGRPQWLTVADGSRSYLERMLRDLQGKAHTNKPVRAVHRHADHVELVFVDGDRQSFDEVVMACHSDQALRLLVNPSTQEVATLAAMPYQANKVYLHTDEALMPVRKGVWSSWNYLGRTQRDRSMAVSVTYWMNSLQRIDSATNYFVSLNPPEAPRDEHIVAEFRYDHPVFETGALQAQQQLAVLQGKDRIWFAGAWTGYGFHEDGVRSGVKVAQALGADIPWQQAVQESSQLSMVPNIIEQPA